MGIGNRIADDRVFWPNPGHPTVGKALNELGLRGAPKEQREAALAEWALTHEPGEIMRGQLAARGIEVPPKSEAA